MIPLTPIENQSVMKRILLSLVVTLLVTVGMVSCNSNSPKASADKFLTSLYHMDYETAKTVSTDDTKKLLDMIAQFSSMVPDSVKEGAKKTKVNIKDVKEEGEKATVTYSVNDPNNEKAEPVEQKLTMVKQKGQWLAQWSKQDGMGGENQQNEPTTEPVTEDSATAPSADGTAVDSTKR